MFSKYRYYAKPWYTVFEDDAAAVEAAKVAEAAKTKAAEEAAALEAAKGEKNITQEQLNKLLAEEKRKGQDQTKKALAEIETLRKRSDLSVKDREELDSRIEILNNELLTKDELAKKKEKDASTKHKTELEAVTADRDTWKGKYTGSTINRDITDASVANNAFSPKQIVAILRPDTQLVEDLDSEGKPTGELVPKVTFKTVDDDDKPVTLTLSIADSVKRMSEMKEYANLFQIDGAGGIGARSKPGKDGEVDYKEMAKSNPEKWRELRKKGTIKDSDL